MADVAWTLQARAELQLIYSELRATSLGAADELAAAVIAGIGRLALFPMSGRILPEAQRPDLREVVVSPYRLIYSVNDDRVLVLTLIHGARRLNLRRLLN